MSLYLSNEIFRRKSGALRGVLLAVAVLAMFSLSATPLLAQHGFGRGHGFGGRGHSYTRFGFGFGGGYYRPFYRPYRSFDFFFSSGYSPYYSYYPYDSYYPYYPPAYYGPVYGYPPDSPSYRITYGDAPASSQAQTAWLNLNVQPDGASVYIDGQYAGRASDFGRNKKLLTVTPTDHTLRFESPGYQPVIVDLRINPLQTLDINQRLQPASSSSPGPAPRVERMTPTEREPYSTTRTQSTAQAEPPRLPNDEPSAPASPVNPNRPGVSNPTANSAAVEFGRINLKFDSAVDNAAVYIDGKFIGVTDPEDPEFMVNDVPSGNHHVVVTRPGYVDFQGNVEVKSGESGTMNVVMQKSSTM